MVRLLLSLLLLASCNHVPEPSTAAEGPYWCSVNVEAIPTTQEPENPLLRHGELVLEVADTHKALLELPPILQAVGAHEAAKEVRSGQDGTPAEAKIVLRFESKKLDLLLDSLAKLGAIVLEKRRIADPAEAAVILQAKLHEAHANEKALTQRLEGVAKGSAEEAALLGQVAIVKERIAELAAKNYVLQNSLHHTSLIVTIKDAAPANKGSILNGIKDIFANNTASYIVITLPLLLIAVLVTWIARRPSRLKGD
jgi:hypothetical protein